MNRHFIFYKVLLIFLILFLGLLFVCLCQYCGVMSRLRHFLYFFSSSIFLPSFLSVHFFFLSNNFAQPKCDEFPYMIQICRNFYRSMCSEVLVEFYLTL